MKKITVAWAEDDWGKKEKYTARAGSFGDGDAEYTVWCTSAVAKKINKADMGTTVRFRGLLECTHGSGEDRECMIEAKIGTRYL